MASREILKPAISSDVYGKVITTSLSGSAKGKAVIRTPMFVTFLPSVPSGRIHKDDIVTEEIVRKVFDEIAILMRPQNNEGVISAEKSGSITARYSIGTSTFTAYSPLALVTVIVVKPNATFSEVAAESAILFGGSAADELTAIPE